MKILVVDDDKKICSLLSKVIKKEGYSVTTANNGHDALRFAREKKPTLVFLDIKMPELSGTEVLKEIKKINPDITVIMLTAYGYMRFVIETMKNGAYDYVTKPFKLDEVRALLKKVKERQEKGKEPVLLCLEPKEGFPLDMMNGYSINMLEIYKAIGKVANVKTVVLIRGESGTGKELVAKAIHLNGPRKDRPFIAVDCASLPPTLLESELFGHEKGSFTGATGRKIGKFEAANSGTLFLDEIGNLYMDTQAKLLRALQEKEIVRVGGTKPIKIDVRIIAATNQDLEKSIVEGKFKADLYYRLKVVPINIPPLRERKEDIPLLSHHFLNMHKNSESGQTKSITKEALDRLVKYNWPGNVRELENVIERAIVTGRDKVIWPEDLPKSIQKYGTQREKDLDEAHTAFHLDAVKDGMSFNEAKNKFETDLIQTALKKTNGSLKETAGILNITLRSLRYMVKKYDLKNEVRRAKRVVE